MEIKTKFDIGDKVYHIYLFKSYSIKYSNVKRIDVCVDNDASFTVCYSLENGSQLSENDVFRTKQELIKYLQKGAE